MCDSKLIIVSETGYHKKHDVFLLSQILEGCELFCLVGKEVELWQAVLEKLIKKNAGHPASIKVLKLADKPLAEVIAFASSYKTNIDPGSEADIVYV